MSRPNLARRGRAWYVAQECGHPMPLAGTTCARAKGHRWEHRSRYAMDNAARPHRWVIA